MKMLEEQTAEQANEKHVPVVEETDNGIKVVVGSTLHPMEEKHHIKFIEVLTKDKVCRAELQVGGAPEAWFPIKKADIVAAREWCNIHGLWRS